MTWPKYGVESLGSGVIQWASAEHLRGADRVCQRRKVRCSTEAFLLEKSVQNAPKSLPVGVIDGAYLGSLTKTCTKCGETKTLDAFSLDRKFGPMGRVARCKPCVREYTRAHYRRNLERERVRKEEYRRTHRAQRSEAARAYREANKETIREKGREYERKNKDIIAARRKAKYPERKHLLAARNKRWAEANPEKVLEKGRRWSRNNLDKVAAKCSRRRARLANASWANKGAVRAVYAEAARLSKTTGERHHVDPIYPLRGETVCGLNVEGNLRVVSASVNLLKKNKLPGFLAHELWDPNGPDVFHE